MKNAHHPGVKGRTRAYRLAGALAVMLALVTASCTNPTSSTTAASAAYTTYLYMTEYAAGRVFTYDPATHTASASSLVTTAANAGEIKFYKGIGYVAIGYGSGGVYSFNPAATAPSATLLPGSAGLFAEYFAFSSATRAYFSVGTSATGDTGGLYWFNPSNPSAGVTPLASPTYYIQEINIGSDGMLYASEYNSGKVVRIDPSTNAVTATFTTTEKGTTGLFPGTYAGKSGVFVANTGNSYDGLGNPVPGNGSLDFIASAAVSGSTASAVCTFEATTFYPARGVQLANGNIIAVGSDSSYQGHTYLVTFSGTSTAPTATPTEIKVGSSPFGGNFSIAYDSTTNLLYVPTNVYDTSNSLYVLSGAGTQQSYSPVSVMTSSSNLANVAFYQN